MAWLVLFVAGLFEVGWAVGLKYTEGFTRPWPDEILMDEKTKALVDKKWKELGIE